MFRFSFNGIFFIKNQSFGYGKLGSLESTRLCWPSAYCRFNETIWVASTTPCVLHLCCINRILFSRAPNMEQPWHAFALSSHIMHTHNRACTNTHWHTSLGTDIYKHCFVARYTEAFIQSELDYTSCASYRGEKGIAKSNVHGFLRRKKRARQLRKIWGQERRNTPIKLIDYMNKIITLTKSK